MREHPALDRSARVDLLRTMVLLRTFHDAMRREVAAATRQDGPAGSGPAARREPDRQGGMRRSPLGCEPMAAGFGVHLGPDDAVTSPRRPHYMAIARGIDLGSVVDDALDSAHGHENPDSAGVAPSPLGDVRHLRPSSVGTGYLPALGQAFAFRQQGTSHVALAILGRTTADHDGFWSAVNVAGTWNLPMVLLLCDDGETPRRLEDETADRVSPAAAHGISQAQVTSDAVEDACHAAGEAVRRARSGGGPSIVEVQTVWPAPAGGLASDGSDLGAAVARDPLLTYESQLREAGVLDDTLLAELRGDAIARVDEAINAATRHHREGPERCPICAARAAS